MTEQERERVYQTIHELSQRPLSKRVEWGLRRPFTALVYGLVAIHVLLKVGVTLVRRRSNDAR